LSRGKSNSRISGFDRKESISDFLNYFSRRAKSDNIDQFFRNGQLTSISDLLDCGKYFLTHGMGCDENDFIPNLRFKEFGCHVPQSETYYPWVFFTVPTAVQDLGEFFDRHGRPYLLSADAGKKDFAVVTNFKAVEVFDFNHRLNQYEVSFEKLYDSFGSGDDSEGISWKDFLEHFGPEKAEERKKSRRKEVVQHVLPKEASPELQYVKRFGHMPSFDTPVGYDGCNFRDTFKTKELPFLTTETIDWDGKTQLNSNRLIWGDNLPVMRSLPDESIDLIYIDPPFFSGRNYNCIFGDDDEVRSFKDIWDGGLPTYLAWLNARLWEMKRLLKPNGVLFIHLDWHACHYVKIELDKIFGFDNFVNEIVWAYSTGGASKERFARKHDNLLFYHKGKSFRFFPERIMEDRTEKSLKRAQNPNGARISASDTKKLPTDVWQIQALNPMSTERIGYPTQKPEELVAKMILGCTNEGDVVADFFSGGGTTMAVAEKFGRRWIGCDISRIAVSVARDRIQSIYLKETGVKRSCPNPISGFDVQNHGVYERDLVREMSEPKYREFILNCYQAQAKPGSSYIHGYKDDKAVFVSAPKRNLRKDEIEEFHAELEQNNIQNGVILTWNVSKEAEKYVEDLRRGVGGPDIQIIQVRLVDIDSNEFKGDNIRFLNKPAAVIKKLHKSGLTWIFDATASCGTNGSDIHYFQWDFNFSDKFSPTTKPNFKGDTDGDGNPLNDHKRIEYTFPGEGEYKVALRVFDKSGAEATHVISVSVNKKTERAA
jgi:DNA modification methylase